MLAAAAAESRTQNSPNLMGLQGSVVLKHRSLQGLDMTSCFPPVQNNRCTSPSHRALQCHPWRQNFFCRLPRLHHGKQCYRLHWRGHRTPCSQRQESVLVRGLVRVLALALARALALAQVLGATNKEFPCLCIQVLLIRQQSSHNPPRCTPSQSCPWRCSTESKPVCQKCRSYLPSSSCTSPCRCHRLVVRVLVQALALAQAWAPGRAQAWALALRWAAMWAVALQVV